MPSSGQGYRIDFVLSDIPGNMDRISLRRIGTQCRICIIEDGFVGWLCGMALVVGEKLGWSRVFRYI